MDNPKVSIIVPIYRVEEYIERCAESLFAQTFDDIESIIHKDVFNVINRCSPKRLMTLNTSLWMIVLQTSRWRSCRELWKNIRIERG